MSTIFALFMLITHAYGITSGTSPWKVDKAPLAYSYSTANAGNLKNHKFVSLEANPYIHTVRSHIPPLTYGFKSLSHSAPSVVYINENKQNAPDYDLAPPRVIYGVPKPHPPPAAYPIQSGDTYEVEPKQTSTNYGPPPSLPTSSSPSYKIPTTATSFSDSFSHASSRPPSEKYGTSSKETGYTYSQPTKPSETYGPPSRSSEGYGSLSKSSITYGPPSPRPTEGFSSSSKPNEAYGPPPKPNEGYGSPAKSSVSYGSPSGSSEGFGSSSKPTESYGPPIETYEIPNSHDGHKDSYRPPDSSYGPPKPNTNYGFPAEYGPSSTPSNEIKFIIYKPENEEVIKNTLIDHAHQSGDNVKFVYGPNLQINHHQKVYLPPPKKSIIYILLKEPEIHTKVQVMGENEEAPKPEVFIIYETKDGVIRKHYDLTDEESRRVVNVLGDKAHVKRESDHDEKEINLTAIITTTSSTIPKPNAPSTSKN